MNFSLTTDILVVSWFVISVLIVVFGTLVLWIRLRRSGVALTPMWVGTPGYLENAYLKWCRRQGRLPKKGILIFRIVSLMSAIIAAVVLIGMLAR